MADDSRPVHTFFAKAAENAPVAVDLVHADTGRKTIEFLNQDAINIAFIDVNMPELSGIEAVGLARQAGLKTFVTLMSAETSAQRLELARQLKVYEYLNKPFTVEMIYDILRIYCRITVPISALIVDDSAVVRRVISKVLSDSIFNIGVTEAADGMEALSQCATGKVDVVFLDCNMPGLDGLATLEHLREIDPPIKVIMNSSERSEDKRRRALEGGALAFLFKPFYGADIDRELHAAFGLKMPMLAGP